MKTSRRAPLWGRRLEATLNTRPKSNRSRLSERASSPSVRPSASTILANCPAAWQLQVRFQVGDSEQRKRLLVTSIGTEPSSAAVGDKNPKRKATALWNVLAYSVVRTYTLEVGLASVSARSASLPPTYLDRKY